MCIPPLYGNFSAVLDQASQHISYHQQLGVDHTFLYAAPADKDAAALDRWRVPKGVTLLQLPWLDAFPVWQRGQNFQINDCVHRAAARGFEWVLSLDIDEWLVLPPRTRSLHELVRAAGSVDVFSFGSRRAATVQAAADAPSCPPLALHMEQHNRTLAYMQKMGLCNGTCADAHVHIPSFTCCSMHMCVGALGHRKHLLRAASAFAANIHFVHHCKAGPCRIVDLDAGDTYLAHVPMAHLSRNRSHGARYEPYAGMPGVAPGGGATIWTGR